MRHAFLIHAHRDLGQADRLCGLLRAYSPESKVFVHADGPAVRIKPLEGVEWDAADYEPDKCRGLLKGLSALYGRAQKAGVEVASFLHPDMAPTDWALFNRFLKRFWQSGKALTFTRMWPGHFAVSWCNLHFRLPHSRPLFPIALADETAERNEREAERWCNELQTTLSWDDSWPAWREHSYPMCAITLPYNGQFVSDGKPINKVIAAPDWQYDFCDYVLESGVVHTHDEAFWQDYERRVRA